MYTWDLRKMCFLWLLDWIFGLNKSFKCICVFKITLLTNVVKGTWVLKESNTFMIYDKKKKTILFSTSVPVPQFNYFICFIVFTTEFSFFFLPIIFISWRLITLQHCSGFCHTLTWISHGFTCVPHTDSPSHLPSQPSWSSQCTSPEHLSHASNLDWRSVSHLIIYMFRCCSLRSSHPCLLP